VSVFKGRVTSVVDDVVGEGVDCIRLKLTSISVRVYDITEKKSYSNNVPEIPTKYGKERCSNRFKVQTRILLSDEMLKLWVLFGNMHRGTEQLPIKSRCTTEVLLFVNICSKITVLFY
jgi:hypothetical protein